MNLALHIARRYLFAKRSTNAINIITGISVFGVAIGTAALLLVLSVFNGFEDLLGGLFGHFNPPVKVTPVKGKTFAADSLMLSRVRALPGVLYASETLEEIAFFEYGDAQDFGVLKGVDAVFHYVNGIDSTLIPDTESRYQLQDGEVNCAVVGMGMAHKLSVNLSDPISTLTIYMPSGEQGGVLDKSFTTRSAYPRGIFEIQQEFDNQYIISNIAFVRDLLGADSTTVSALEIRCKSDKDIPAVKRQLAEILGPDFQIKDQYQQNEAFFKVMRLEKWMGFAITALMLILMAFNTLGALWMIVLEKQKDISVLKSMGASEKLVRNIFLTEGLLLSLLGLLIGLALALILYALQKTVGLIRIPDGFLVREYPISMRIGDFVPVVLTVLLIGLLAALPAALRAMKTPAYLREE